MTQKHYIEEVVSRIAGIPCLIGVISYHQQRGSYSYHADSDLDFYGYVEAEWDVLDRNGRAAPWLESKMSRRDEANIYTDISNCLGAHHDY